MKKIAYNKEDLVDHHAAAAIIKNDKGEILMQEHTKLGFWTLPSGKIKPDQSIIEGIKEEVFEETNLNIEECKEISIKEYPYLREGKEVTVTQHIFNVTRYSGKMKNKEPNKHKSQLFLPLEEIKKIPYLSYFTLDYLECIGFKRPNKIE